VLITGGSSGLGLEAAQALAADASWHVVITGRREQVLAAQAARIGAEAVVLDLGSLKAVREFTERFNAGARPPLRAIVCNAGIQNINTPVVTPDGNEQTFAVNHLGHFLLVTLLIDEIQPPGRIVIVSSNTHDPQQNTGMPAPRYASARELADPAANWAGSDTEKVAGRRRYTTSKLCNLLFAYELDRRIRARGITVNAFDPGMMPGTGLARDYPLVQRLGWKFILPALTLTSRNINTPGRSGRALARLVSDPLLEDVSGQYWSGMNAIRSSDESYDAAKALELWNQSAELVQAAGIATGPADVQPSVA
jgi:light-dependent protochlorophyllide reductase